MVGGSPFSDAVSPKIQRLVVCACFGFGIQAERFWMLSTEVSREKLPARSFMEP